MHADGTAYLVLEEEEHLPEYIATTLPEFEFAIDKKDYPTPRYQCLYISGGKKDKISKGDILGFLVKVGGLSGDDIGVISILDKSSYVAVAREKVKNLLTKIKEPKIKKIRVKIEIAT